MTLRQRLLLEAGLKKEEEDVPRWMISAGEEGEGEAPPFVKLSPSVITNKRNNTYNETQLIFSNLQINQNSNGNKSIELE